MGHPPRLIVTWVALHSSIAPQATCEFLTPHVWPCVVHAVPTGGHAFPASSSIVPPPSSVGEKQTGSPHVFHHFSVGVPPSDWPPLQLPVTTASHPDPQVADEAQPIAGLWHAIPAPPLAKVQG